ncbi:MAG TPA: ABC transporter permease, partial [Gaiellaceae bacterium]|nr:ABC transporter permease [Gaiellaceae bacterium]
MARRILAGGAVFAAAAIALAFLILPIAAIFARVSPGRLVGQLSHPVVTDALLLSLKTSAIAQALVVLVGTPAAYVLATRRFPGRSLAVVLVELPLVLPPAVAGIGLIAAFGRLGLLGGTLDALGIQVGLTQAAVVIAVAYVSSPFYVRQAIATFEAVDPDLVAASRTLGAGRARTFFRVVLPLARRGLAAGEALSFARGLGEFGATIMFAGSESGPGEGEDDAEERFRPPRAEGARSGDEIRIDRLERCDRLAYVERARDVGDGDHDRCLGQPEPYSERVERPTEQPQAAERGDQADAGHGGWQHERQLHEHDRERASPETACGEEIRSRRA